MIILFLCFKMHLSVVEFLGSAHARQVVLVNARGMGIVQKWLKAPTWLVELKFVEKEKEKRVARMKRMIWGNKS